jgi:hypothetical protein
LRTEGVLDSEYNTFMGPKDMRITRNVGDLYGPKRHEDNKKCWRWKTIFY